MAINRSYDDPTFVDPGYMKGNRQIPTYSESTNDTGGTFGTVEGPIGNSGIQGGRFTNPNILPPVRNYTIQGGKFVDPGILPPVRQYTIQGGRFVPAAESLLPPVRQAQIQIDYEHAYHFGNRVSSMGRREE
jgi:hypothetical protein